jgi:hypothetical protein
LELEAARINQVIFELADTIEADGEANTKTSVLLWGLLQGSQCSEQAREAEQLLGFVNQQHILGPAAFEALLEILPARVRSHEVGEPANCAKKGPVCDATPHGSLVFEPEQFQLPRKFVAENTPHSVCIFFDQVSAINADKNNRKGAVMWKHGQPKEQNQKIHDRDVAKLHQLRG